LGHESIGTRSVAIEVDFSIGTCFLPFKEEIDETCGYVLVVSSGHDKERRCRRRNFNRHERRAEVGAEKVRAFCRVYCLDGGGNSYTSTCGESEVTDFLWVEMPHLRILTY
jgi:hypothetical protein